MEAADLAEQTERHWADWRALAQAEGTRVPDEAGFQRAARRVWEASEFVRRTLEREPRLLRELLDSGELLSGLAPGDLHRHLAAAVAGVAAEAELQARLRRFRRRHMVRIIWRDLAGWAPVEETLEDLTALADACLVQALDLLHAWLERDLGQPLDLEGRPQRLLVLAMGKMGARELNLSSDIDLIFAFRSTGPVRGSANHTSETFFLRLTQRLIQALHQTTVDGFVFRVDTRLRPFGEAGPLVLSFPALEDYYQAQAREWERYAMVKARVVAGDPDDEAQLTRILRPFVYRRYLDFGAIESLRELKRLISRELIRKGMEHNVKLGPGGIREIEFIGQVFQIIRGGREPRLQIRPILAVLALLAELELRPAGTVAELQAAYRFLRLVENRIQAWRDQQTHLLPVDEEGRLRLARAMGFETWDNFATELNRHRELVQNHFDALFGTPKGEDEQAGQDIADLWLARLDDEPAERLLAELGFQHPADAWERLRQFQRSSLARDLGNRGRDQLDRLMPRLLEAVGHQAKADPDTPGLADRTLERLIQLLEAVARRTTYLALLAENGAARAHLVRLVGASPWIAAQLARSPLLLDELLDQRRLFAPLRHDELRAELEQLLAAVDEEDLEQQMERLRQFAQSNRLRVAAADLAGAIQVWVVSDHLTDIADIAVEAVLRLGWNHLVQRHGRPQGVTGADSGFAVIGYGKLGGLELGYGSDLDLVFLHGNQNPNGMTGGERPIANDTFYARLGQRLIHMLSTRTPAGILYEVDARLRPDGGAGLLVSSLGAFEQYQLESAWTWEHQALLRARPVAGDALVMRRFRDIRRQVLSQPRDPAVLRGEVRDMREKMRQSLDRSRPGRFDLKQGPGGIADIEFMVQYAVLRWANQYPELLDWTANRLLLADLSRLELLPGQAGEQLFDAYLALRAAIHRNSLQNEPGMVPDDRLTDSRALVRDLWQRLMEAD